MIVQEFESAVAAAKNEPKGVKVSLDLWKALKEADLIVMRDVAAWGGTGFSDSEVRGEIGSD